MLIDHRRLTKGTIKFKTAMETPSKIIISPVTVIFLQLLHFRFASSWPRETKNKPDHSRK